MNVKRAFSRRSKQPKFSTLLPSDEWVDTQISKARYILGFSDEVESSRNGSTSSASTSKLRSVTFSEASTAPVQIVDTSDDVKAQYLLQSLQSKIPLVSLYDTEDAACQRKPSETSLQPQSSNNSLRSYYDKSLAPLSISQQTSDSSSRDFALRKGTPSILTDSAKETEHLKQLRLVSKSEKRSSRQLRSDSFLGLQNDVNDSLTRLAQELTGDDASDRTATMPSKESVARISVVRGTAPVDTKAVVPIRHVLEHEHRLLSVISKTDPTRAKLNVRRPKAGTKNWFDDIDSESDEEVETDSEPQLEADFALPIETAFERGNFDIVPPRTSSRLSKAFEPQVTQRQPKAEQPVSNKSTSDSLLATETNRSRKSNRFAGVDLQEQSVLYLSSSEDEDEDEDDVEAMPASSSNNFLLQRMETRPKDVIASNAEDSRATSMRITIPDISSDCSLARPPIPERNSGRLLTYLQDQSTESLSRHDDLLTSFPLTPTDTLSRHTSFQSIDSESDSQRSTKLMNLTKQEENLIAALRSKRVTMMRAQALAHRQDALRILELDGDCNKISEMPPKRQISLLNPTISGRSNRSSILTYMTDTSQDLQLSLAAPRTTVYESKTSNTSERHRQKHVSTSTLSSITTQPLQAKYENSINTWDLHDSPLDKLDKQPFREDIPSQLFMERPYLGWQGWEGQTEMQMAH